jgi:hypothetical protein
MAQPKDPPISFRPGEARLARIAAWAKERNLSRHLAILTLIDAGLRGEVAEPPSAKPRVKPEIAPKVEAEPARVHVAVPLKDPPKFRPNPKRKA